MSVYLREGSAAFGRSEYYLSRLVFLSQKIIQTVKDIRISIPSDSLIFPFHKDERTRPQELLSKF